MSALSNPQQFLQPSTMTVEQLQQTIQAQVHGYLNQYQAQADAAQQTAAPAHSPEFQKAIDAETKLIEASIKSNPTLRSQFGRYNLDQAINGDGGPTLQQLAHRIDDAVVKSAGFGGDKDTPLTDLAAVTKAVQEGSRHFASLDMSVEDGASFASGVAEAVVAGDNSVSSGDPSDFDYEREGPQPDFQEPDAKVVAEHFKATVENHGGHYEPHEKTILETAPDAGQEPEGFFDG